MERVKKSIIVDCPLQTVYNQWTQFEDFPRFMEGVKRVTQLDDKRLHWEAEIGGKHLAERSGGKYIGYCHVSARRTGSDARQSGTLL